MGHNITEVDNFDTTVPVPDDGDAENAASVNGAFQALADRTNKHKLDLAFMASGLGSGGRTATDGVIHIRRVTSLANLQALFTGASAHDGESCWVDDNGLYVFHNGSAATVDSPFVVAPNAGTGRWILQGNSIQGAANGIPRLDANTKVKEAQIINCVDQISEVNSNPTAESHTLLLSHNNTTYTDVTGTSITLNNLQQNDIIVIDAWFSCQCSSQAFVRIVQGTGPTVVATLDIPEADAVVRPRAIIGAKFAVPAATSSITVKLQSRTTNGANSVNVRDPFVMRCTVFRP